MFYCIVLAADRRNNQEKLNIKVLLTKIKATQETCLPFSLPCAGEVTYIPLPISAHVTQQLPITMTTRKNKLNVEPKEKSDTLFLHRANNKNLERVRG